MAHIGMYMETARCTLGCLLGKKSLKRWYKSTIDIYSWASSGEGLHGGHNLIGNWTISSSKLWFANNTKMQQAIFDVWWVDQEPTLITKLQLRGFLMSRACTMLMLEARKRHETKTWAPLSLLTLESWTATDVGQSDKRLTWKKTLKKLIS